MDVDVLGAWFLLRGWIWTDWARLRIPSNPAKPTVHHDPHQNSELPRTPASKKTRNKRRNFCYPNQYSSRRVYNSSSPAGHAWCMSWPSRNFLVKHSKKGKVHFLTLNSRRSSIFNLQLRNRLRNTLQLSKPDKFGPRLVSKAVFYFREAPKFYIIFWAS